MKNTTGFEVANVTNKNALLNHIHVFNGKTSCKIFQNLGASLQELTIETVPIINGIEVSEKGVSDYQSINKSSLLFPFPGRIENGKYVNNQRAFQLETNETNRHNAIHGLVFDKYFEVDSIETSEAAAKVVLSYTSDEKLAGFPFKFQLIITYLISNSSLQLNIDVKNLGEESFPFGLGWHPYFKSDDLSNSFLSFSSEEQLVCDENQIPKSAKKNTLPQTFKLESRFFDDTFILLDKEVTFKTDSYDLDMIFSKTSKAFLQIFTPLDRNSIAIEPMSCSPNVFNNDNGLKTLQAGESYTWQVGLNFRTRS